MKIIWKPNPLDTSIEFEPYEDEMLKKLLDYEQLWGTAVDYLHSKNPEEAKAELKAAVNYDANEDDIKRLKAALQSGHMGDCTSVPCSCWQCWAEEIVGVNTIEGLDNSMGYKIFHAAEGTYGEDNQIDLIIEKLENYNPPITDMWKGKEDVFYQWLPKWKDDAKKAAEWMKVYKKEHDL